jgi:hypothetical protein
MANDTKNVLTDFDLALALAQRSINNQMDAAWKAWKRRNKQFTGKIRVYEKMKRDGVEKESKYGMEADIAPLTISLNVPDGKLGQVRVTLRLTTGAVKYNDEFDGDSEHAIKDWSVSFLTSLDTKPVDLRILKKIEPNNPALADIDAEGFDSEALVKAKEIINASGLPDSVFSIEYLFMKFTDVKLLLSDNKDIHIPDDVPKGARDKALSSLQILLDKDLRDFPLGTVVRRNSKSSTPTFALTDFIFNVHADAAAPDAATLAYLGMVARRPLPDNTSIARTKLADNWVRIQQLDGTEANVSGVMAISKNVFFDLYLIPKFTQLIGLQPVVSSDGLTYTFSATAKNPEEESTDIIKRKYNLTRSWSLTLSPQVGTNRIAISGQVTSRVTMDGYLLTSPYTNTEGIYQGGHRKLEGAAELTGSGSGVAFQLGSTISHQFGDPIVDENNIWGGATVLEGFGVFFKALGIIGSTPGETMVALQKQDADHLQTWLDQVLKNINVALGEHAFIPPGGGVFTFNTPRFSAAGDLLFNVIYLAP